MAVANAENVCKNNTARTPLIKTQIRKNNPDHTQAPNEKRQSENGLIKVLNKWQFWIPRARPGEWPRPPGPVVAPVALCFGACRLARVVLCLAAFALRPSAAFDVRPRPPARALCTRVHLKPPACLLVRRRCWLGLGARCLQPASVP